MMIIRVKKHENFFVASNEPFQDDRLSIEATGVMGYILSRPNDWELRNQDLMNRFDMGAARTKKIIRELKDLGYVRRYKRRDDDGRFVWHTDVYESVSLNPDSTKGQNSTHGTYGEYGGKEHDVPISSTGHLPSDGSPYDGEPTHIENTDQQNTEIPPRVHMINALVEVTGLDGHRFFSVLSEEAENLLEGEYIAHDIRVHYGREPTDGRWNWYLNHWKGRKGDWPKLEDIWETISGATKWKPFDGDLPRPAPSSNGRVSKQELLEHLEDLVGRHRRRGYKQAMEEMRPELAPIAEEMGRWEDICRMNEDQLRIRFYEAYNARN